MRASLMLWAILAAAAAQAQVPAAAPPAPSAAPAAPPLPVVEAPGRPVVADSALLQEVTVAAPEPRWVAPTRRDRIGRIWAPVMLNGQGPFRLVLDTGANRSAVIGSVADTLGEKARTSKTIRLRGVTGTAIVPLLRIDRMEIGDLLMQPAILPVVPDVFGGAEGVLGNEGLRDKRIVIDFRRDSITVKRSRRERPPSDFQTLPITTMRDHLLAVDVFIGRVRAKAIIDTGAPDTLGNSALLEALKHNPQGDPTADIQGVTLELEHGSRMRMPTISMGRVKIRGVVMTFSDVYIFKYWGMTTEPTVMLGMDVLGVLDQIILDYRTHELHLLTPGS